MQATTLKLVATAAMTATLALANTNGAAAKSSCKGLNKLMCEARSSCVYVPSYKTKAGSRVDAYCRSKGGKGKTSSKLLDSLTGKSSKKTKTKDKSKEKKSSIWKKLLSDDYDEPKSKKKKTSKKSSSSKSKK